MCLRSTSLISLGDMNIRWRLRVAVGHEMCESDRMREVQGIPVDTAQRHPSTDIQLTNTSNANSGNVNVDHGIKCSSADSDGSSAGTKRPPSGA
jgi:hypothetical protein